MHSVRRSPEPRFLAAIRQTHTQWGNLDVRTRVQVRDALARDFGCICAYCEQPCQRPTRSGSSRNEETIDHFRPRSRFPNLQFDWLNLIYACKRCNQRKDDGWPGYDGAKRHQLLAALYSPRYTAVSEYVDPNTVDGQRQAGDFFDFNFETGEIKPTDQLGQVEWSMAQRNILDIDLNDGNLGENDPRHLKNQRLRWRDLLIRRLDALGDVEEQIRVMSDFTLPDKPFSGFLSAYFTDRFPGLG